MEKPPRYELYDLHADPCEFRNLAAAPEHAAALADLKQQLTAWREQTQDPLLNPTNLTRLKAEVYSVKSRADLKAWGYPDYFFGKEPAVKKDTTPSTEQPANTKKQNQAQ